MHGEMCEIKVKGQPNADNGDRIMTQHKTSCLAAVLVSLCITFMPGGTNGCADQIRLTGSITGRNACLLEEVTITCTVQGDTVFWRSEAFEEKTIYHTSAPSTGQFTVKLVSYDRNQSCLVSSLSFNATASLNGTTVTCTNRNRTSNQSLSLHTMSNVALENLTVVPLSLSSVQLEWKVTPTDGNNCISNYSIQIAGPNGSQWREEIPGSSQSFHFTGLQLVPWQNYTCSVTAILQHNQVGPIKQTLTVELQEPHPPTNLSAVIQCNRGYEIQFDWQVPLFDPHAAPLTGYLLQYHFYNNTTTIELPALNTSYTLDGVPSDVLNNITVSALSDVGPSRNNPSVQLVVPSLVCENSLATPKNTSEPTESRPFTITIVITALTSGVAVFSCVLLLAAICYCVIMLMNSNHKKESKVSESVAPVSQQEDQQPHYEEIPMQNYPHYYTVEDIA